VDLTSPAGKMTMQVINAVTKFELDVLIKRTLAGISRAKAEGRIFGRPSALTQAQQAEVARVSLQETYGFRGSPVFRIAA
jgi:putative DNA-invertase from lambdoid prophage Rac